MGFDWRGIYYYRDDCSQTRQALIRVTATMRRLRLTNFQWKNQQGSHILSVYL